MESGEQLPSIEKRAVDLKSKLLELFREYSPEEVESGAMCRKVNSQILLNLIRQGYPGIIYTVKPIEGSGKELDNRWLFHSVGVIELDENQYAVYDVTNTNKEGIDSIFFNFGTLEELDEVLSRRFGSDWRLSAKPVQDTDTKSVKEKITKIKQEISEGTQTEYTLTDVSPDYSEWASYSEDNKRLGITFIPPLTEIEDVYISRFIKPYA